MYVFLIPVLWAMCSLVYTRTQDWVLLFYFFLSIVRRIEVVFRSFIRFLIQCKCSWLACFILGNAFRASYLAMLGSYSALQPRLEEYRKFHMS